jgi:hypothetical protein
MGERASKANAAATFAAKNTASAVQDDPTTGGEISPAECVPAKRGLPDRVSEVSLLLTAVCSDHLRPRNWTVGP